MTNLEASMSMNQLNFRSYRLQIKVHLLVIKSRTITNISEFLVRLKICTLTHNEILPVEEARFVTATASLSPPGLTVPAGM